MNMLKAAVPTGNHKRFSPEAYADFPIVCAESIHELHERMKQRTSSDDWETLEDATNR